MRVKKSKAEKEKQGWPGQVFEREDLSYEEAMNAYIEARAEKDKESKSKKKFKNNKKEIEARKKELLEEERVLRDDRRKVRERRKDEDQRWRNLQERISLIPDEIMRSIMRRRFRAKRRVEIQPRKAEDQAWREKRDQIRLDLYNLPILRSFVAILVVVDNCTRQCLGLPMFVAGKHVTAQMVVDALSKLLPPHLQYLIADRGIHFKAQILLDLAELHEFKRVLLAPHRPQSNGIAERFVQTLKAYLTAYSWETPKELRPILRNIPSEYNDRPHQGDELKGLSPNEYAKRLKQGTKMCPIR